MEFADKKLAEAWAIHVSKLIQLVAAESGEISAEFVALIEVAVFELLTCSGERTPNVFAVKLISKLSKVSGNVHRNSTFKIFAEFQAIEEAAANREPPVRAKNSVNIDIEEDNDIIKHNNISNFERNLPKDFPIIRGKLNDSIVVNLTDRKNYLALLRLVQFSRSHPSAPLKQALEENLPFYEDLSAEVEQADDLQNTIGPLPMPTSAELAADGKGYKDRCKPGPHPNYFVSGKNVAAEASEEPIILHLKTVWMPWIVTGEHTRPELLARDPAAYSALGRWLRKGNDLREALGHDIPSRSDIARSGVTPEAVREARRIMSLHNTMSKSQK